MSPLRSGLSWQHCLAYYAANGEKKERTARFIERIGIDEFKKSVL